MEKGGCLPARFHGENMTNLEDARADDRAQPQGKAAFFVMRERRCFSSFRGKRVVGQDGEAGESLFCNSSIQGGAIRTTPGRRLRSQPADGATVD